MGNYRMISTGFWDDTKVKDDFTPEDKYFYMYLLTNPHTNICGCYEIGNKSMEQETGYNLETVMRLIKRMEEFNVIRYHPKTKEMLILNWWKHNWTKSEKMRKAVEGVAQYIKYKVFRQYVTAAIVHKYESAPKELELDKELELELELDSELDVSIGYTYRMDTVSEKPKRTRFVPPTVEEVAAYCSERQNRVNPQRFVDFYASKGWKVGKEKMQDWKAAVRTWEQRDEQQPVKPGDIKPNGKLCSAELEAIKKILEE